MCVIDNKVIKFVSSSFVTVWVDGVSKGKFDPFGKSNAKKKHPMQSFYKKALIFKFKLCILVFRLSLVINEFW